LKSAILSLPSAKLKRQAKSVINDEKLMIMLFTIYRNAKRNATGLITEKKGLFSQHLILFVT
jgi:hypothetical protein